VDLRYAGDRRRFCRYAGQRNIRFELARPSEAYDVVVVTNMGHPADTTLYQSVKGMSIRRRTNLGKMSRKASPTSRVKAKFSSKKPSRWS